MNRFRFAIALAAALAIPVFVRAEAVLIRTFLPDGDPEANRWLCFGMSVALAEDAVVVAAPGFRRAGERIPAGRYDVFDYAGNSRFSFVGEPGREFGATIAASEGHAMFAGRPGSDCVLLADLTTGETSPVAPPDGRVINGFGASIAADAGEFLVGAPKDNGAGWRVGAAHLYDAQGVLVRSYLGPGEIPFAGFGSRVALSEGIVALEGQETAPGNRTSVGGRNLAFYDRASGRLKRLVRGVSSERLELSDFAGGRSGIVWGGYGGLFLADPITAKDIRSFGQRTVRPLGSGHSRIGVGDVFIAIAWPDTLNDSKEISPGGLFVHAAGALSVRESIPNPEARVDFGTCVAAHDRYVLVGAPTSPRAGPGFGAAYLYEIRSSPGDPGPEPE